MTRVRFVGDSDTCVWLGVSFVRDQWVEHRLDAHQLVRVAEHPHFEIEAAPKPPKRKA